MGGKIQACKSPGDWEFSTQRRSVSFVSDWLIRAARRCCIARAVPRIYDYASVEIHRGDGWPEEGGNKTVFEPFFELSELAAAAAFPFTK